MKTSKEIYGVLKPCNYHNSIFWLIFHADFVFPSELDVICCVEQNMVYEKSCEKPQKVIYERMLQEKEMRM